jgi:signal transduction histidine kinase
VTRRERGAAYIRRMKTSSFSPETLDTRIVFRAYATLAAIAGVGALLVPPGAGTTLVAGEAGRQVFVQLTGCLLVALGCATAGFGEIEDPRSRHRALGCFAFAHLVLLAGVVGVAVLHGGLARGDVATPVLVGLCVLLFYFWQTGDGYRVGQSMGFTKLFGGAGAPDDRLRSAYEEQIREAASQEERHRLARDLHDSVKQQIFAMQAAAATVQARYDTDAPGAREALERMRGSGREAMAEMEAMLDSLRATALTNAGLVDSLKKQGEALQFRTGARVSFDIGHLPAEEAVAPGARQAIFRVAQEAFANIGRHARAANVAVRLGLDIGRLVLRIRDDGAGFQPSAPAAGMGLANMRERAAFYGAGFDVRSEPGAGTTIVLSMPCAAWAVGDVAGYRARALGWGLTCACLAAVVVAIWLKGARVGSTAGLLAGNLVIFGHSLFAYHKARKRAEGASWTGSPSHS